MQNEVFQMHDAMHPQNPALEFLRRLTTDRHTLSFLLLALALLAAGVSWLWKKWKMKRCTEETIGTVLSASRTSIFRSRRGGFSVQLLISYHVDGKEYQDTMNISSRSVERLSDIDTPTFELLYNPRKPSEFFVSSYERSRLGRM